MGGLFSVIYEDYLEYILITRLLWCSASCCTITYWRWHNLLCYEAL